MPGKEISDVCIYCKEAEAIATVRRRRLCRGCFIDNTSHKVARCMVSYRALKDVPARKLLLPLSLGLSSCSLLHILDRMYQRQLSSHFGNVGFELHVLIVDPSTINPSYTDVQNYVDAVKELFPRHTYTMVPLHSIFQYDGAIKDTFHDFGFAYDGFESDKTCLDAFRASISTATAKDDLENLLLVRLITAFAKNNGCEGILWGDSDTRLAAKTLANVAKGRGASVTWQVCDGASPWGIDFSFPLRDLFIFELELYAKECSELDKIIMPETRAADHSSSRNLSIDELMIQYVKTQGEKYPGVMANVVRIANKLQPMTNTTQEVTCSLCASSVEKVVHSGDNEVSAPSICYACLRSRADITKNASNS